MRKTILIDLDGVLNEYTGNFDKNVIPCMKQGSKEFLENLSQNFEVKIFTTRNKLQTAKWLIKNELDSYISDITNVKDPAFLHVDDRCINFNGDFEQLISDINNFRPYWKG